MQKFYESYLGSKSKIHNPLFSKRGMPEGLSTQMQDEKPQKRSKRLIDPLLDLDCTDPLFDEVDNIFVLPITQGNDLT